MMIFQRDFLTARGLGRAFAVAGVMALSTLSSQAMSIQLNYGNGVTPTQETAFRQAADFWEDNLRDNISINLNVDFSSLDPGILANAYSEHVETPYWEVRNALIGDISSNADLYALINMPDQNVFTRNMLTASQPGGLVELDDDDLSDGPNAYTNNFKINMTKANAKALGLDISPNPNPHDGTMTFSTNFAFDYMPDNGIDAGKHDFVGIVIHEIGHSLGFTSGVDIVDTFSGAGPGAGIYDLDQYAILTTLDLFRYSEDSVAAGGVNTIDLMPGNDAYFSLDGGLTAIAPFSEGQFHADGDGRQGSHWKDNLGIGIMDPTIAPGEFAYVTGYDFLALDVIGYDMIPVPGAAAAGLMGFGLLSCLRRRKK